MQGHVKVWRWRSGVDPRGDRARIAFGSWPIRVRIDHDRAFLQTLRRWESAAGPVEPYSARPEPAAIARSADFGRDSSTTLLPVQPDQAAAAVLDAVTGNQGRGLA